MSVDAGPLAQALYLATGAFPGAAEVQRIADALGVVEEVAPWLVLRAGGYADSGPVRAALKAAAARAPGGARTVRPKATGDLVIQERAKAELASALLGLIEQDLAAGALHRAAARARRDLAAGSPADDFDAHLRIAD